MRLKFGDDGIPIKQEVVEQSVDSGVAEKKHKSIGGRSPPVSRKRIKKEYPSDVGTSLLTYKEAKRLINEDKDCGLKEVYEKRHITIGWHQCGRVSQAVKYIFSKSLGRYRHQLKAVPLAIGRIEIPKNPLIIADQPCMHLDACARTVIFRPLVDHQYRCIVTSVGKRLVTAKIFNGITFIAPLKDATHIPQVGDEVLIRYQKVDVKESMCQMRGVLVERRTKKRKRKMEGDE
uniref:Uncharacterized protein n=1 Tax=Parascaris univalens TaxID=6257 RepID=A0A915BQ58_PARUN